MPRALLAVFLLVTLARAQVQRAFDVASIKESPKGVIGESPGVRVTPTSLSARATLRVLVANAYSLQNARIADTPAWATSLLYDLKAKTEIVRSKEDILSMLRTLLADRFNLKAHRELREVSYLVLVAGSAQAKLKALDPNAEEPKPVPEVFHPRNPQGVADMLASWMNVPVADETGIAGNFNMTVDVRHARSNEGREGSLRGADLVRAMEIGRAHV